MNRFFEEVLKDPMLLCGDNHLHLAYSLRLKAGDEIVLFCGDEFDYRYKITNIKKNETALEFISKESNFLETGIDLHAFVSLIKHDKMSLVYQKLTELGVKEFYPVITEYSQGKKGDFNPDRYHRICIEACKQCGRSVLPKVNNPVSFAEVELLLKAYETAIFAYEKSDKGLKKALIQGDHRNRIAVLIGPEGGFSKREAETLINNGVADVSLGKRILRAETAAIAIVSAVLYEFDW